MGILRIAAVQAAPSFLDLGDTLGKMDAWARRAAGEGAKVVAFPETWVPGYPAWIDSAPEAALWGHPGAKALFQRLWENAVRVPGTATERIGMLAAELRVTIVAGVHERAGRTLYNSLLTFSPAGVLVGHHRKLVPTYTERMIWGHGDGHGLAVAAVDGIRIGGLVCWEHWMPLARQRLHDLGEDLHVAVWPTVHEMHQVASRHYAFEGRCFVMAVGGILRADQMPRELPVPEPQAAERGGLLLSGGSAVMAPDGRYLAGPVFGEETLVMADCDMAEIGREAMTLDVSGHYSRPDVFEFRMRELPPRSAGS